MWELIFLMAIMKLPILYLCGVVWWAVRAQPLPPEPVPVSVAIGSAPPLDCRWRGRRRPGRRGPTGPARRGAPRRARSAR